MNVSDELNLLTVPQPHSAWQVQDVFPRRVAYAQELRLAGANNRLIAALLHIDPRRVSWYLNPDGFAAPGLLPWNGFIVIDPSPNSDDAVIYDEWGHRKVGFEGEVYVYLQGLVAEGVVERTFDYIERETFYRAKQEPRKQRPPKQKLRQVRRTITR